MMMLKLQADIRKIVRIVYQRLQVYWDTKLHRAMSPSQVSQQNLLGLRELIVTSFVWVFGIN